jgi:DNA-binding NarL/FixJ family response regulator
MAVLDVVYMMNGDHGDLEISPPVLARLADLVGCDSTFLVRAEQTPPRVLHVIDEPEGTDPSHLPGFAESIGQHPAFAGLRSGRLAPGKSTALSDLADLRTLRRLAFYVDFSEPRAIRDQLFCMAFQEGQQVTGLVFNRSRRGFAQRDRAVADLVGAHLSQVMARRRRAASLLAAVRILHRHHGRAERAVADLSTLTPREREVVEHVVEGATNREIARSLAISQRTVHKHLERIYCKLDLTNRTGLMALIQQPNGL